MDLGRAATHLVLRSSCPLIRSLNGSQTCSQTFRRIQHHGSLLKSTKWSASLKSNRSLSTTRSASQQAAAAKKDEDSNEADPPAATHPPPDSQATSDQNIPQGLEQQATVAKSFLQGTPDPNNPPTSSSQPPSNQSTQPGAANLSRRRNINPLTANSEIIEHFSFLREKQPIPRDRPKKQPKTAQSSFEDMLSNLAQYADGDAAKAVHDNLQNSYTSSSTMTPPPSFPRKSNSRADASRMLDPTASWARLGLKRKSDEEQLMTNFAEPDIGPPNFRIDPFLARTIDVNPDRGMDFARAVRSLDIRCAANSVKADLYKQRFYERPGLKRKRLASQRWRRRFKDGFNETIKRVKEIRRQGW